MPWLGEPVPSLPCRRLLDLGEQQVRRLARHPRLPNPFGLLTGPFAVAGRPPVQVMAPGPNSAPPAETPAPGTDHLVWRTTTVQGRPTTYGVAGSGMPVLFLHGWALGQHSYKRALKRLVRLGCQVYAPAMPGFGGTADLPRRSVDLVGYATWVRAFLDAVGVVEPVFVIGHSFGGGVAVQLAHDYQERVSYLVLINSVGGATWLQAGSRVRSMAERPLWDWVLAFPGDLFPLRGVAGLSRVMLEDALPNVLHNPLGLWRAGQVARRADLTAELRELKARGMPMVALRSDQDNIIPKASFEALCAAIGSSGEIVHGHHSWLLADPDTFGEVMANSLAVAREARRLEGEVHGPGQVVDA
ncbi:MAG: alpha/beta hydrolase [Actinomycetota bacterium]|nr:alpha/beta hydrolase [Actinomycetota bacterium]